jgi:hypothetical protein
MKPLTCCLLPVLLSGLLVSAVAAPAPAAEGFGFSLIPNAFTRNPLLSMTVFTELTDYGRTLAPATVEAPVYFQAHDRGLQSKGETVSGEISPTPAALQDTLFSALAGAGYLPAPADRPSQLVLIYYWGSHLSMDPDLAALFPELHQQRVMERAMLVGGRTYRQQVRDQIEFGYTFADRTPKKNFLIHQATQDLNFVVVSAYDRAALAKGKRQLAWRTTMTVSTAGVSMKDSLPPLVMTAGAYFGRETAEPVAINRRARRGTVNLGPLTIIADSR